MHKKGRRYMSATVIRSAFCLKVTNRSSFRSSLAVPLTGNEYVALKECKPT